MKKLTFCILLILISITHLYSQIHGIVSDEETGKPISNAVIYFPKEKMSVQSDAEGKFIASIKPQEQFTISHIAYQFYSYQYTDETLLIKMKPRNTLFTEIEITGYKADYFTPVTTTNISGIELVRNNNAEDIPQMLEYTPSAVVTSDAGNGIGYTGIRIRGTDASRINVTINGVPFNDAESQQSYWVDINDIAESIDDIQIQRGVGTSSNGISSFGGAIHLSTNQLSEVPFAKISAAIGSYQLYKTSASFGTGRMHEHWFMEGRFSKINSEGYIDRAYSDLFSFAALAAFKSNQYSSILNVFSGKEKTYQSWGGVPEDSLETNRTYNPYTYENQTDNYLQTHIQWHNKLYLNNNSFINLSLNFTPSNGYYEQYEQSQNFSDYGAENFIIGADTIFQTNMITQKWLENKYYGAYLNYETSFSEQWNIKTGFAAYQYQGNHFGKIIWAEYALPFGNDYEWYRNHSIKTESNVFSIIQFSLSEKLKLYSDVQLRTINYQFEGYDDENNLVDQSVKLLFFNPKLGFSYQLKKQLFYLSLSKSGHEPNRDDYTESSPSSRPKPEILYDLELGNKLQIKGWNLQTVFYGMYYKNQLILTGEINDVGAYTRTNIPISYRAGIEFSWAKLFYEKISWSGNLTFSRNKIHQYLEYIDNWDTGEQIAETYSQTTIAFSPSCIGANKIEYFFLYKDNKSFSTSLSSKYVSKQYIDNTTSNERTLDAYFIQDLGIHILFNSKKQSNLTLTFLIQNLLNEQYETNAWLYRYQYEGELKELNGYFPQAERNYLMQLKFEF